MSDNDTEAYLYSFEMTATAACWSPAEWVTILSPYLMGQAQVVLRTMPAQEVSSYQRVKAANLDHYEVTEETQWQQFWGFRYKPGNRPKALIAELKNTRPTG